MVHRGSEMPSQPDCCHRPKPHLPLFSLTLSFKSRPWRAPKVSFGATSDWLCGSPSALTQCEFGGLDSECIANVV